MTDNIWCVSVLVTKLLFEKKPCKSVYNKEKYKCIMALSLHR